MCGVAGLVRRGGLRPGDREAVERMTAALRHRGPDAGGVEVVGDAVLGHRRLSIVELSELGAQPMRRVAPDGGEVAISYNGEVYNHAELRRELEGRGVAFRGHSDTEVVLEGWRAWGEGLVERLEGMFALGVWDARRRTLFLARDRYGKKPLYYVRLDDGGIAFASELRAILLVPGVRREADPRAVAKYLAFDGFPGRSTALRGVEKLRPGEQLVWEDGAVRHHRYYRRRYGHLRVSAREAEERLWELLVQAVRRRLMSEVPLGVFLSGGLDSSAVVAAMATLVDPRRIQTFAIGFQEPSFDESAAARQVAAHFGTEHHEQILDLPRLLALVPEVLGHLDEPLADVSIVPTYALCKFARERVTVALGGDGGDELFAGYDTFLAERVARAYLRLPGRVRAGVSRLVELLPPSDRKMSLQFRARRFVRGLDPDPVVRNQRWFGSFLPEEAALLVAGGGSPADVYEDLAAVEAPPGEQASLELWTSVYLPDNVLTKVDRASMAVALEARAPLLDRDFASFAHGLPYRMKLRGLTRKWIFKRMLRGRLPEAILRRQKQGFGAPNGEWLRGPLRADAERLLDPARLARGGLIDPGLAGRILREHLAGSHDHRKQLWALYVLERWRERWGL